MVRSMLTVSSINTKLWLYFEIRMASEPQAIVSFLYKAEGMTHFNMSYYLESHVPATKKAWGPFGMESCTPCSIENKDDSGFSVQVVTIWKDMASWNAAKVSKEAKELAADLKHFTDGKCVTVVGNVLI
jgi:uncharacterized protein (TIGR02118 family)